MSLKIQIVSIAIAVTIFIIILNLVRARKLKESYSLLWLSASGLILILTIWKGLFFYISRLLGVVNANSIILLFGFSFLFVLILHLCVQVSKLSEQNRKLIQRLAIFEREKDIKNINK